jgi:hypothetical protein
MTYQITNKCEELQRERTRREEFVREMFESGQVPQFCFSNVKEATITSSSGTNYDDINESIPVAEPSSWFLLAFAIVGLFAATVCNQRGTRK